MAATAVAAFVLVHMRVYLHSDQFVVRVAVSYKLCASTSAHHAALALSWFWCRDGIVGRLLDGCERAVDSGGLLATHCGWEHTPMSSETQKAALQCWNQEARPRGPRHSGPTAPVGWAQNTISTPDVFLRFGSATTSKSHLIVFDCVIIQCCRLFLLFLGEKILSFNHTYLIAAIGATLIGPCLSSVMVMIMRLCLCWAV